MRRFLQFATLGVFIACPAMSAPPRSGKGWMYVGGIRETLLVRWPVVVALVSLLMAVLSAGRARAAESQRPNIVFIISDDHAWTDYGFMGHPQIETPNLDRLAARSAVFPRGYVPTALCRPALATLVTGLYAHQHKISGNDPALLPGMPTKGGPKQRQEPAEYKRLREKLISHIDRHVTLPKLLAELLATSATSRANGGTEAGGGGLHARDDARISRSGRPRRRRRTEDRPRGHGPAI